MRRQRSAAKVRWSVEEELRVGELTSPFVGELASPCGGAQANMVFPYLNWGSIQLEDKATWWGVCRHHVNGRVFYAYMTRIRRHF